MDIPLSGMLRLAGTNIGTDNLDMNTLAHNSQIPSVKRSSQVRLIRRMLLLPLAIFALVMTNIAPAAAWDFPHFPPPVPQISAVSERGMVTVHVAPSDFATNPVKEFRIWSHYGSEGECVINDPLGGSCEFPARVGQLSDFFATAEDEYGISDDYMFVQVIGTWQQVHWTGPNFAIGWGNQVVIELAPDSDRCVVGMLEEDEVFDPDTDMTDEQAKEYCGTDPYAGWLDVQVVSVTQKKNKSVLKLNRKARGESTVSVSKFSTRGKAKVVRKCEPGTAKKCTVKKLKRGKYVFTLDMEWQGQTLTYTSVKKVR